MHKSTGYIWTIQVLSKVFFGEGGAKYLEFLMFVISNQETKFLIIHFHKNT